MRFTNQQAFIRVQFWSCFFHFQNNISYKTKRDILLPKSILSAPSEICARKQQDADII